MAPKEQHDFIRELCDNVRDSLLKRQYPEEWDGHELRVLIAERFEQSARMSLIKREPQRKRARSQSATEWGRGPHSAARGWLPRFL